MAKIIIKTDGAVKVFRNDDKGFPRYAIGISTKNANDEWESAWQTVRFKKGVEVENRAEIIIKSAFPTFRKYNGNTYWEWVITDFDYAGNASQASDEPQFR